MKRLISYGRQVIDTNDVSAVARTLRSQYLTQGPKVSAFEKELAKVCGARFAVATTNGTMALLLAYQAAGIGEGDEVIVSPNTFVATTNMLLALRAKPVFSDIRLDNGSIDESKVSGAITSKTSAIVPVYFGGTVAAMKKLRAIAKKRKLMLVADAAHALGAVYTGKAIGGLAHLTTLSFHPVKSITTGEGGAVLTNSPRLYRKLRLLCNHGLEKDAKGFNVMKAFGWNARLSDISASLGLSQLQKLPHFIRTRRKIALLYRRLLSDCEDIILPAAEEGKSRSAWHLFVIQVRDSKNRLPLYRRLKKRGILVNFHYPPVYAHPYYRLHGYTGVSLRNMEDYAKRAITLPLHAALAEEDVYFIAGEIKRFFKERS